MDVPGSSRSVNYLGDGKPCVPVALRPVEQGSLACIDDVENIFDYIYMRENTEVQLECSCLTQTNWYVWPGDYEVWRTKLRHRDTIRQATRASPDGVTHADED